MVSKRSCQRRRAELHVRGLHAVEGSIPDTWSPEFELALVEQITDVNTVVGRDGSWTGRLVLVHCALYVAAYDRRQGDSATGHPVPVEDAGKRDARSSPGERHRESSSVVALPLYLFNEAICNVIVPQSIGG